jgi:uncharacterized membrane protein
LEYNKKKYIQIVWGFFLVIAGVGIFINIPEKIAEIQQVEVFASNLFFIRLCFYLISILLVVGGLKKIYHSCYKT